MILLILNRFDSKLLYLVRTLGDQAATSPFSWVCALQLVQFPWWYVKCTKYMYTVMSLWTFLAPISTSSIKADPKPRSILDYQITSPSPSPLPPKVSVLQYYIYNNPAFLSGSESPSSFLTHLQVVRIPSAA